MDKVKSLKSLKKIVEQLKQEDKRIVFTNGCFDLIHPGHIELFHRSKEKGDVLIVGLNSDSSIRKIKGESRPILNEKARMSILSAIEDIDYIILFDEETPYRIIEELKPHCLVKGSDWEEKDIVGRELVEEVVRVKLVKEFSTSRIIEKIVESSQQSKIVSKVDGRKLWRIVDVNFNRCKEGLRVVEDVFRFVVEKKELRGKVRRVRHRMDEILQDKDLWQQLVESRDSYNDIGREVDEWEEERKEVFELVYVNLQRAKEAMRVLEEVFKIIDKKKVEVIKPLRYELYSLEKETFSQRVALCDFR